jgi:uncharacterized repeat protein (TIGR01451 family)
MKLSKFTRRLAGASVIASAALMVGCHASGDVGSNDQDQSQTSISSNDQSTSQRHVENSSNRLYYPTGERASSVILLEKSGPAQVRVGQPYNYQIKVTNLTDAPLQGVTVQEMLPGNFRVTTNEGARTNEEARENANAQANAAEGRTPHQYAIGELGPKESRTISVSGTPSAAGQINSCVSVTYNPTLCTTAMVINPQLKIIQEATSGREIDICSPMVVKYTVTNSGTGTISNVRVDEPLPEGMTTMDGQNRVAFNVGTLNEGQSRAFEVKLKAAHPGAYTSTATALADEGLTAKSDELAYTIRAPRLVVSLRAPEKEYLGQDIHYEVTVKNTGDAPARNPMVRVDAVGDNGAQTAAAREGGQPLGEIAPGQSKSTTIVYHSRGEGDFHVNAVASDPCAGSAMAAGSTSITGIPALLLEAADSRDPVRVGENVTYTINVLNQGNAADHNIRLVATLPDGEQYVNSDGPTQANAAGSTLTFSPLQNLSPKQTATWHVEIKALKAADVRFKVEMTSESCHEPAVKMEQTRLY